MTNSRFFKWFLIVNAGLLLTTVWLGGLCVFFPIIGTAGALLSLAFSRWLAIRSHNIVVIDPLNFKSDRDRKVYEVIADLAKRAQLPATPAVGIYESSEMNGFATGATQEGSLVAFSSALVETLPAEQFRAVAAHEIGHIACRDVLAMVMLQAMVNTVVLAATAPLRAVAFVTRQGDNPSVLWDFLITAARMIVAVVLTFFGSLGVKAFSRQREYRADAFAARLVGGTHMAAALRAVEHDDVKVPHGQAAYAALKFSGRSSLHEWLSTHPDITKRIAALEAGTLLERPRASSEQLAPNTTSA
jgi:heat shock protein HtpX